MIPDFEINDFEISIYFKDIIYESGLLQERNDFYEKLF